jgi:hypothetical protein
MLALRHQRPTTSHRYRTGETMMVYFEIAALISAVVIVIAAVILYVESI